MKSVLYSVLLFFCLTSLIKAQTPQELKSWLPPVNSWTIDDNLEVFNPENLFDRINGAAPLFLENNFREMTSMEYKKDEDYITIQAYRHETPEDAFGMYSSERSTDLTFYPFAVEAHGDDSNLYFIAGNIYVKMWGSSSDNISTVIQSIAKELANKIDPKSEYPTLFKAFDSVNKIPYSEAFITSNYIGHEFLKRAYIAQYNVNNKEYQAFIIDGLSKDGAKEMLTKYFTFTKQTLEFKEGALIIKDRYNGEIPVIWKDKYIIGVFNVDGNLMPNSDDFLRKISQNLN